MTRDSLLSVGAIGLVVGAVWLAMTLEVSFGPVDTLDDRLM